MVDDTCTIPFVDTEGAARYLALSPHSLECYRSLGGGPPFYKFGKFVRYAVLDLETWAAERRHHRTSGVNERTH
ncbi:MAG TPA: DNA-binding protein [Sphingomonadaceae bacterium]|nr:DNA-binding protein [Sphingomonadaceae bacterium]